MYNEKLKAIATRTQALLEAGKKIRDSAQSAKRELTEDEVAEIDKISAEVRGLNAERQKLAKAQGNLDLFDDTAKALAEIAPRVSDAVGDMPQIQDANVEWAARVKIPAEQNTGKKLVAFKGQYARQEAYAFGQWFLGAVVGRKESAAWCKDHGIPITKATLTSVDNASGGALVPYQLHSAIIDLAEAYGVFRQYAENVPMTTDVEAWPRVTGGMTTYFVGDNTAPTASNPTFDNIELVAREIAAYATIPASLAEDSIISLADLIARKIGLSFATMEDNCGFIGDGTSTYGGCYGAVTKLAGGSYAGSVYDTLSQNTAFSTLDLADFEAMVGKLPEYPGISPAWYFSKAGWAASMMRLADAAGGNQGQMIVNGIPVPSFLGYPVVWSATLNKTLTTQTSTAIGLFGDLRMAAMFGTRRAITIALGGGGDFFTKRQSVILGSERFAINVHECGSSSVAGPLLVMKTASS